MSAREEIAAAASTITGVTVAPFYRQNLKAGSGFVSLISRARGDNGFGYVDTWGVLVAIPQDVKAAEEWLEEHLTPLMDALDAEMVVQSASPDTFTLRDGVSTNAVSITGTREA